LTLTGTPDKVAVSGTHAADFTVSVQPGSPVATNAYTTFKVVFAPGGAGLRTAELSIDNDDIDENPYNFTIQGTGRATPEMDVWGHGLEIGDGDSAQSAADGTDFGTLTLGNSITNTFVITNSGSASLTLTGTPDRVAVSGTHAADFAVSVQPGSPVEANAGTTFNVVFSPGGTGLRTANLSIDNSDSDENPYNFAIQGKGHLWGKLTAWDGAASNFFGYSVSVDGDVALVGATHDAIGGGRFRIYFRAQRRGHERMGASDQIDRLGCRDRRFFRLFGRGGRGRGGGRRRRR
ncbi:MAG: choice-of-anchor D domain-containing protein, partial [Verrucomicrobia bacterium]|nr:choice-of-anchor D domain-containing protein [Verrucomicrobiota bacterium]